MNATYRWLLATAAALLLSSCATQMTMPTPEEKAALAPSGKLRLALLATYPKDPATGEFKGPAVDIGKELAARLDVPFAVVTYRTATDLYAGTAKGEWDVFGTFSINPERASEIDHTAPYVQSEMSYLVKGGAIRTIAEIDRTGIRVAVTERTDTDAFLSKSLKHAELIRVKAGADAEKLLNSGGADAYANAKTFLIPASNRVANGRVLDGSYHVRGVAFGVPKGNAGASYLRRFVDELKAQGYMKTAVERHPLPGYMAAP